MTALVAQLVELLPQKPPFRFVDEIVNVDDHSIVGKYTFTGRESFYAGHFPGAPITPGVILLECICQVALCAHGVYLLEKELPWDQLARVRVLFTDGKIEFERVVEPGQTVFVKSTKLFWRRRKLKSTAQLLSSDGELIAAAEVAGMEVSHRER